MWHASVALLDQFQGTPVPLTRMAPVNRKILIAVARWLLEGVGETPSLLEEMDVGIHYRRVLTDVEYNALPPAWCALPAIDLAGHGKVLEENT